MRNALTQTSVVGFSVNPELLFTYNRMTEKEKGDMDDPICEISGSSANVALAINTLTIGSGIKSRVLALTGPPNDRASILLRTAQKDLIPYEEFPILEYGHISILPIDGLPNPRTFSRKGEVILSMIEKTIPKIEKEESVWRICTAIRPSEKALAKALFNNHDGYRVLNPRPELIKDKDSFYELLKFTDLLIMNQGEFNECEVASLEQLHERGPTLVIVTQAEKGGLFSHKGEVPERFEPCHDYITCAHKQKNLGSTGAGDWFSGAFVAWCKELEKSVYTITMEEIREGLSFSARVAGKKVTMKGGWNGPGKEDL